MFFDNFAFMNIKKCTSLFLVFLLLVSNIGFAFDVHYCGGDIASVSFKTSVEKEVAQKCCAINEKDSSCCKDAVVHVEKNVDTAVIKSFLFQVALPFLNPTYSLEVFKAINFVKNNAVLAYYVEANAPPLFKLYQQFIFYA